MKTMKPREILAHQNGRITELTRRLADKAEADEHKCSHGRGKRPCNQPAPRTCEGKSTNFQ